MLEVNGINIDSLPFEGLEVVNEILSFEGHPILVHFRDQLKNDLLGYWVDFDDSNQRWLFAKITKQELFNYLIGAKSLKDTFTEISSDFLFIEDTLVEDNTSKIKLLNSKIIPDKYLPKPESFYLYGLNAFYSVYLSEYDYVHKLRERSYIVNVKPGNSIHSTTVGAKAAAIVLNGFVESMEGYIYIDAFQRLVKKFASTIKINRRINKLIDKLTPRIAQTAFNSFEVWLAMDTVTSYNEEDDLDADLRKTVIQGYKQNVLDIDYSDENDAKLILEKYNEDAIERIYKPIIKVFDNQDFSISIQNINKKRPSATNKINLKQSFKDTLFPKPTLEQVTKELERKNKIYSLVINLKEGEEITKISKRALVENLIFKQEIGETPYEIQEEIVVNNKKILPKQPLRFILRVDADGNLQLSNTVLDIYAEGNDMHEVVKDVKSQFAKLLEELENNPKWSDRAKIDELRKYI